MHWRWFLPFPLAAFLCGEAVRAPELLPPLPHQGDCFAYEAARERYLLAYGLSLEKPRAAEALLSETTKLLKNCPGSSAELLRARAEDLRKRISR